MKRIFGNLTGLKPSQLRRIESLSRRRTSPRELLSPELAAETARLSREIRRQIGLLLDRQGRIHAVTVGDSRRIVIPASEDERPAPGRLRGLRCVHTHLDAGPLSREDLTDLALLRLDLMAAIAVTPEGEPSGVFAAHLLPANAERLPHRLLEPLPPDRLDIDCAAMIAALEGELERVVRSRSAAAAPERALLVSVSSAPRREAEESLRELEALTRSCGLEIAGTILQQREAPDVRTLVGSGKLQDLAIQALQEGATLLVFDQELSPSQIRSITDRVALKVIDRTQLILDLFAQRARSREGKLQVELAQLRYLLPRLTGRGTAMSRLAGGIGGRGPGETQLELDRRKVRRRIQILEDALEEVRRHRAQLRMRRARRRLPIVSIIGYTNAGKSTLLNTITHSRVLAESRLFATLDPTSRRVRFPQDLEVILTDTVGFIRNLPEELRVAFRATLEELESADLLLHVVDLSHPRFEEQMAAVEDILAGLNLEGKPTVRVFNKVDRVDPGEARALCRRHEAIAVSALDPQTLRPLIAEILRRLPRPQPLVVDTPS